MGTPANWNRAIAKATGTWIKLIHDDDWFTTPNSLKAFADHTSTGSKFIFSAYANHFEDPATPVEKKYLAPSWGRRILKEPMTLLAYNVIGPPSVVMIHRSVTAQYDEQLKWRVDMEYYVRLLEELHGFEFINEVLVNVGVSASQVTQSCIYQPSVELPEGKILLQKHGDSRLENVLVYDAWWRLLRNMHIHSIEQLETFAPGAWPAVIQKMVGDLRKLPPNLLQVGVFSKTSMFVSYLKNKSSITRPN
jgi:glycosyltransferase involved in cell wall biosynthesis